MLDLQDSPVAEAVTMKPPLLQRAKNFVKGLFVKERRKSNLIAHAKREFLACGYEPLSKTSPADPDTWMQQNVLELLEVFSQQGHSGFSAPYCVALFEKLANFEPLCPLTGHADEWVTVGDGLLQNKRCSRVFCKDGQAYDTEGKMFKTPDGLCYTSKDSCVDIVFPYTPVIEYVDVPE